LAVVVGTFAMPFARITLANQPWAPMTSALPGPSILVPTPKEVPGKDFSDVRDRDFLGAPDPEQVVAWDGLGGVRDSFDYTASRPLWTPDTEVDGISAGGDALFQAVRDDRAALLFSVETDPTILFERATGFPAAPVGFGVWATAKDIDAVIPPMDTDGLEIWGGDNTDDSDRYSLAGDPFVTEQPQGARKVAIWDYDSTNHVSNPHTYISDLAASIDKQFGGPGDGAIFSQLVELMDVDAIMTLGPMVTFSVQPIDLTPFSVPLTLDGGEIFEYDGPGIATRFLKHGGHVWDTLFDVRGTFGVNHENIDALEAVATKVPEPSSAAIAVLALLAAARFVRRR
jgi:hypothetical protein